MTRFTRMMLTSFDDTGLPSEAAAEWQWINLDHVERIHEHVHEEPVRESPHRPDRNRYLAFLVLTFCSGALLALPAGRYDSDDAALDGLIHVRQTQLGAG
ncbi:hypothetical protein [Plantibacter sp. MMLR14_011]|uniref:hypothetical protein n=1 Tax=Plantibacter sp. MMLR14_011 TaxID=1898746 RepID=UPI0008DE4E1C|nr:hypothetical protein [Plantibacter sp. MMLR14_011]OII39283.1 hypothetical protein BIU99_07835 [Plantibacter sp. MMLR14_011]